MEDCRTMLYTVVANTYALAKNKYSRLLQISVYDYWSSSTSLYKVTLDLIDYMDNYVTSLEPLPELKIMDNKEIDQERAIRKNLREKVRLLKLFLGQLIKMKPEWSKKTQVYMGNTCGVGIATISDILFYIADCFSDYV